ncbi:THxN family PEP-CTERM protein [Thalassomonas viridans]|uniref:THxN family PEP-CTERM protein n=1 Tax=Thalassomonas viridans TaxID=137584 RepID=A0AAE9Z2F1_9GAMM|nr:THxN family PEP-CTERM protein [Thalassomonas viridans]WDE05002.1 THxN family PEP-CTERM protein [Thalassomonas viridans]
MKNTGWIKNLTALALASAFSFGANATFMTATSTGGFIYKDAGEFTDVNGNAIENPVDGQIYDGVRWGGNGAYSSLILESFSVDIDALDTNYMISSLTHNNFRISADFDWLTEADIAGSIDFSSANSGGIAAGFGNSFVVDDFSSTATSDFDIEFTETFNRANPADCSAVDEDGIDGGDKHTFTTGCDDYFDYSIDNPDPLPDVMPFAVPFYIDGKHYALTIFTSFDADGSTVISQDRVWTEEETSTTVYTFARLTEVPEPSMIALFGLGLLGLGFSKRKANK